MKKSTIIISAIATVLLTITAGAQDVFKLVVLLDNAGLKNSEVKEIHEALRATKIVRDNTNAVPGAVLQSSYHVFGVETYASRPAELRVIEISSDTEFVRRDTTGFRPFVTDCSADSLADINRNTEVSGLTPAFLRRYGEIVAAPTLGIVLISRNSSVSNLLNNAVTPSAFQEFIRIVNPGKLHVRGLTDKEDKPLTTVMSRAFEEFVNVATKRLREKKSEDDELGRLRTLENKFRNAETNIFALVRQLDAATNNAAAASVLSNELSQAKRDLKKTQDDLEEAQKEANHAKELRNKIAQAETDLADAKEALENGVSAEEAEKLRAQIANAEASLYDATNRPVTPVSAGPIVVPTDVPSEATVTTPPKPVRDYTWLFFIVLALILSGGIFALVKVVTRKKYGLTISTEGGEELQLEIKGNAEAVLGKLIEDIGDASSVKIRAAKMDGLDGGGDGFQICEPSGNWFLGCGSEKTALGAKLEGSRVFAAGSDEYKLYSSEYAPRPAATFTFEKI
ncbi:MAG: hypothetical protein FWG50_03455 [Kiritimatiellaeota bacterium]|nr:hypothetical protein [Kiritimatiellota bacterium]